MSKELENKTKKELKETLKTKRQDLAGVINSNDPALIGKLIGKLNQIFYGKNFEELTKYFEENNISIVNKKDIKDNFDELHFIMQIYLTVKLTKEIKDTNPKKDKDYYKLAMESAIAGKKYFEKTYKETPLENLISIQPNQISLTDYMRDIANAQEVIKPNSLAVHDKALENTYALKETKSMSTKNLKLESTDERKQLIKKVNQSKKKLSNELSKLSYIRKPEGYAIYSYNIILLRIYKTKDVKTIIDLKNKLGIDTYNIEDAIPSNHLKVISYALEELIKEVQYKQETRETRQSAFNLFERVHTIAASAYDTIKIEAQEENPEAKNITPYKELKKYVKTLK